MIFYFYILKGFFIHLLWNTAHLLYLFLCWLLLIFLAVWLVVLSFALPTELKNVGSEADDVFIGE